MPGWEWFAPPPIPCKRGRLWHVGHAQDGILRSDLTVNIALFLSSDGIALAHRQTAGHWAMIGETALDVPDLSAALADLRTLATERVGDDFEALLVLPDDQILYTSLTAPTADPELTAFRIEEGLDGLTPYAVTELEYDWRVLEEDRVKIAVCARETLDEARGFAAQYGFVAKGFAAMPPMERFPGVPTFDLGAEVEAMGFTAEGIAFGPDTHGMPEPEVAPEPETEVVPEPEPTPEPEVTAAPVEPEPAPEPVVEAAADPEPEAVEDRAHEPDPVAAPTPTDEPDPTDQNPALAEALMVAAQAAAELEAEDPAPTPVQGIEDPSISGPIAAIASDATDGAEAPSNPQETVGDAGDKDDALPPPPSPASLEARQRARVIRGEPAAPSEPLPSTGTGATGQFAARRGPTAAPDGANRLLTAPDGSGRPIAAPEGARGSLVGQRSSRLGLTHPDGPARAAPTVAPAAPVTPTAPPADPTAPTDGAPMPRLAEQLQRVRNASKSRPSTPTGAPPSRPRVEIDPQPALGATGVAAERRPSPFDDPPVSPSASSGRGGRLAGVLGRGATASPSASVAADDGAPAKGRFTRRRKGAAVAAPSTATPDGDEVFSSGLLARKSVKPTGGSFKTGLVLTIILLLLLALVAIWSAVFLPNGPVARWLGMGEAVEQVAASSGLPAPNVASSTPVIGTAEIVQPSLEDEAAADGLDLAVLVPEGALGVITPEAPTAIEAAAAPAEEPALPDIDAEFDLPPLPVIDQGLNPTVEEAEALYAEDGIWARSPERPDLRPFDLQDRVYTASIDPEVSVFDAVALPDPGVNPGELLRRFPPPPAFGAVFDLTASGLISPTPEGVLTPEGAFVIAGPPPFASVPRPREIASTAPATIDVDDAVLGTFRPAERPGDLSETRERQILGGLTQVELGERRPAARPASPQEAAAAASLFPGGDGAAADPAAVEAAVALALAGTDLAVTRSLMPRTRPGNIAQIVASADRTPTAQPTAVAAEAIAAGPSIPSNADVSRAATERNAIRLRNVNLIGVSGTPSDRRGLVRLSSGRFVRVTVGDRLDGGRVAAIGETTLQYVRSGRTVTLEIPG